jgi:hypothetical protein
MIQHLSLLNPFIRISDEATARAAARGGAVALLIGAAWMVFGIIYLLSSPETMTSAMEAGIADAAATDPETAKMAEAMLPALLNVSMMFNGVLAAVMVVLAVIQWRKMTETIPLIFLLLCGMGALSMVWVLAMTATGMAPGVPVPSLQVWMSRIITLLQILLFISAYRGGRFLARARKAA